MRKSKCMRLEKLIELVILREYEGLGHMYVEQISTYDGKEICVVYYAVNNDWDYGRDEQLRNDTRSLFKMLNPAHNEGIQINID